MRKTYIIKDSPVQDFALSVDPDVSEEQEVEVSLLSGGDAFKMKVKQPTLRKAIIRVIRTLIAVTGDGCHGCGCKAKVECGECDGRGLVECDACGGTGKPDAEDEDADGECGICDGEGEIDCDECDGGTTYLWSCGGTTRRSGGCGGEPSFTMTEYTPEAVAADDDLDASSDSNP